MATQKSGRYIGVVSVLIALFLFYIGVRQDRKPVSQDTSSLSYPVKVVFTGPSEIEAGKCTKFSAKVLDSTGAVVKNSDVGIRLQVQGATPILLSENPKCVDDEVEHTVIEFPNEKGEMDFYASPTTIGDLTAVAMTIKANTAIATAPTNAMKVIADSTSRSLEFSILPNEITEKQPFILKIRLKDKFGNSINENGTKLNLSYLKNEAMPASIQNETFIMDTALKDGIADFTNLALSGLTSQQLTFVARQDQMVVTSPGIKVILDSPRAIEVRFSTQKMALKGSYTPPNKVIINGVSYELKSDSQAVSSSGRTFSYSWQGRNQIVVK